MERKHIHTCKVKCINGEEAYTCKDKYINGEEAYKFKDKFINGEDKYRKGGLRHINVRISIKIKRMDINVKISI